MLRMGGYILTQDLSNSQPSLSPAKQFTILAHFCILPTTIAPPTANVDGKEGLAL